MSKYKYGDILHHKPSYDRFGYTPVQIIKFDVNRDMYLCFVFDMDGTPDCWHLAYMKESELGLLDEINESENSWKSKSGEPIVPYNLDTRYFRIYIYENEKMTLIQKDVGKRKNKYDLPTR